MIFIHLTPSIVSHRSCARQNYKATHHLISPSHRLPFSFNTHRTRTPPPLGLHPSANTTILTFSSICQATSGSLVHLDTNLCSSTDRDGRGMSLAESDAWYACTNARRRGTRSLRCQEEGTLSGRLDFISYLPLWSVRADMHGRVVGRKGHGDGWMFGGL
jgi:hypothetical protein